MLLRRSPTELRGDHEDTPDKDKCTGKCQSCPVVPTVISGVLRARLSGVTSRDVLRAGLLLLMEGKEGFSRMAGGDKG